MPPAVTRVFRSSQAQYRGPGLPNCDQPKHQHDLVDNGNNNALSLGLVRMLVLLYPVAGVLVNFFNFVLSSRSGQPASPVAW